MGSNDVPFEVAYLEHYLPMLRAMQRGDLKRALSPAEASTLDHELQRETGWTLGDLALERLLRQPARL